MIIPVKDGAAYIGDINLIINADDSIEFSSQRLLDLLANLVDGNTLKALQGSLAAKADVSPSDLAAAGIGITYNPRMLELDLDIASEHRVVRSVQVSPLDRERFGSYVKRADFSAYINMRTSVDLDYSGPDKGLRTPVLYLDGATRIGPLVAESEAIWQPGATEGQFQRLGSRMVFDDEHNLVRWTVGDLKPVSQGLQSIPDMSGISIFRSYSVLQPQQIAVPRGDRSFTLQRASTVEVQVNGQIVQRLQLAPGRYDLRNFPFANGANDVKLSILDDAGRSEVLRFNLFLGQSQLAKGLSEFGLYAGVKSPLGINGPQYSGDFVVTGFYRRGISDRLTLGVNFQGDKNVKMGGVEVVSSTLIGILALNFSLSDIKGYGSGWATTATLQRLIQRGYGRSDSFNLSFQAHSRNFGALGTIIPTNPYSWEVGAAYSHTFNDRLYAGFDGHFSRGRDNEPDLHSYRVTAGLRVSDAANLTADVRYDHDRFGGQVSGLVSLNVRLGRFSSVRAEYDSKNDEARLSYQAIHGSGVGSYNISADIDRNSNSAAASINANLITNRAELGFSHYGTFTNDFGESLSQRSSFRIATSLALADGAVSIGRPIYDSFAIVKPHRTLGNASVVVDPSEYGHTASTGILHAATEPNLASYSERTVTVDAPTAPPGTDLGSGSFRLYPAYRSGYKLVVGSDYAVTALGRLLNADGEPVSLVTGRAIELAHPDRPAVQVFTNRDGRFGITGLAPGKWHIEMLDDRKSAFDIVIPDKAVGALRLGDLRPQQKATP